MTILTEPNTGDIPLPVSTQPEPTTDLSARTQLVRVPAARPAPAAEPTKRIVPPPRRPAVDETATILYRDGVEAPATIGDLDVPASSADGPRVGPGCRRHQL